MTLRRSVLVLAVALAATLPSAALAGAKAKTLVGVVGPGYTITLKQAGKAVKTLKAGTYTIKVEDKASIHNFHLMGNGLNKLTTVAFTGTQTWKVKLKAGKYTFQCDPHAALGMKGTFTVKG